MASVLPALRRNLDLMPSPVPDRPGLLLRDPYRYAEAVLVVPSPLVPCLAFFDGRCEEGDLRVALARLTGDVRVGEVIDHLRATLSSSGFLEDDTYLRFRDERHKAFADAPRRDPAHAGTAYPWEPDALRATLDRYLQEGGLPARPTEGLLGVAAPHVSPEGGWRSYAAAYGALGREAADRTFVVLGTSHYGEPERFGLTRKPFLTPYGVTSVDLPLTERLVESGVVFLQHLFGPAVRILPVLCGALPPRARPEDEPAVARFVDALGELAAGEGDRLAWVLGVDMAHVGRRYGDDSAARAGEGAMTEVEARDRERCARLAGGTRPGSGTWSGRTGTTSAGAGPLPSTCSCGRQRPRGGSCCGTSNGTSTSRAWSASPGWPSAAERTGGRWGRIADVGGHGRRKV
jgi:AmmeMemoRadiSam system protein B